MNDVHRRPFKVILEAAVFKKLFCSRYGLSESRLPSFNFQQRDLGNILAI